MIASLKDLKQDDRVAHGQARNLTESNIKRAVADTQFHGESLSDTDQEFVITFFADGFMVGQGEFKSLSDPENLKFMSELGRGLIPEALLEHFKAADFVLTVIDKTNEPFNAAVHRAFAGEGQKVTEVQATVLQPVDPDKVEFPLDKDKARAQVQFRFHNGRRKNIQVNLESTIRQLYEFVALAAPVEGLFQLIAGFPPTPLENYDATVEFCQLQGTAITQKLV